MHSVTPVLTIARSLLGHYGMVCSRYTMQSNSDSYPPSSRCTRSSGISLKIIRLVWRRLTLGSTERSLSLSVEPTLMMKSEEILLPTNDSQKTAPQELLPHSIFNLEQLDHGPRVSFVATPPLLHFGKGVFCVANESGNITPESTVALSSTSSPSYCLILVLGLLPPLSGWFLQHAF